MAVLDAFQLVYLAAAVLMVGLGVLLLVVKGESAVNRALALVFFARGGLIVLGQSGLPTAGMASVLNVVGFLVVPFVILHFLLTYRGHYTGRTPGAATSLAVLGAALAMELLFFSFPDLFFSTAREARTVTTPGVAGPLFFTLNLLPLAYIAISLVLAVDFARSPAPLLRMPLLLISAAFLLDPLFLVVAPLISTDPTASAVLGLATAPSGAQRLALVSLNVAALVCGLGAIAAAAFVAVRSREAAVRRAGGLYVGVAFVTVLVSVAFGLTGASLAFGTDLFQGIDGLLTLAAPVLVAYAILRYQVFDLDLRLKDGIRRAAVIGLYALAFAAVAVLLNPILGTTVALVAGGLAALALLVLLRPVRSAAQHLADAVMPGVEATPDYIAMRKLEVYRTALEEAQARGSSAETEERVLQELRRSLGVSDDAHRAMMLMLRAQGRKRGELTGATRAKFRIERSLGQGGFGKVYLAHDVALDRQVVLKQPTGLFAQDENSRRLFLKEARLAARIQHPNVVAVHQVIEEEDPPMLVMEYVDGGSLADRLAASSRLSPEAGARLASDVLSGLARIHGEGIVHRDVKPANILLTRDGTAKITDFGIAHADSGASALVTVAGTGYQPGSLAYMSPEQARGDPVDARSDLYSLAVVLHEAVTGRHYLGDIDATDYRVRTRIQAEAPDLAGVPDPWRRSLERALAKDPAARFGTAAEMAAALEAATSSAPRPASAGGATPT